MTIVSDSHKSWEMSERQGRVPVCLYVRPSVALSVRQGIRVGRLQPVANYGDISRSSHSHSTVNAIFTKPSLSDCRVDDDDDGRATVARPSYVIVVNAVPQCAGLRPVRIGARNKTRQQLRWREDKRHR